MHTYWVSSSKHCSRKRGNESFMWQAAAEGWERESLYELRFDWVVLYSWIMNVDEWLSRSRGDHLPSSCWCPLAQIYEWLRVASHGDTILPWKRAKTRLGQINVCWSNYQRPFILTWCTMRLWRSTIVTGPACSDLDFQFACICTSLKA